MSTVRYLLPNLGTCRIQLMDPATCAPATGYTSLNLKYMTKEIKPIDIYKGVENINDEIIKEEIKQRISIRIQIPNNPVANTHTFMRLLNIYIMRTSIGTHYLRVYPNYTTDYTNSSQDYWDCVLDGYPANKQLNPRLNIGHVIDLKLLSKYPEYFYPKYPTTSVTTNPIGLSNAANSPDFIIGKPELILNEGFEIAGGGGADVFEDWTEATAGGSTLIDELVKIHSGAHAVELNENGGESSVNQAFTVVAETNYRITFWTRGDTLVAGQYEIYDVTGTADILTKVTTGISGAVYTKITHDFATPAGCVSVKLTLFSPSVAGDAYFDDVSCQIR